MVEVSARYWRTGPRNAKSRRGGGGGGRITKGRERWPVCHFIRFWDGREKREVTKSSQTHQIPEKGRLVL